MSGFQTPINIKQAIDRINTKAYLLPAFQREYVWSSTQIENLFDSLMKGYPISSMLFWKVSGEAKQSYKFYKLLDSYVQYHHIHNDAFNTNQVNDFHAILDGQQRLTSIYLGLCGTYAYHKYRARYDNGENNYPTRILYLNISKEFPEDENDKTYDFSFKEQSVTNGRDLYINPEGDKWFRVGHILNIGSIENSMDMDIDDFQEKYELSKKEKKVLALLKARIFDTPSINYYEIDKSSPDEAVNIFVRINSGGSPLSFSDMIMSMAIAGWQRKDARTEINRLVDMINNKGFSISKDYVLKAFLYLYKSDVRFKLKTFNNVFIQEIEEAWEGIRDCIDELFEYLRTLGLDRTSLTSNNATFPILYYIYHRNIYKGFATSIAFISDRNIIRTWLLKTLILRSFRTDNILQKSHTAFTSNIDIIKINDSISRFPADEISKAIGQQKSFTDEFIDESILSLHKDNQYTFAVLSLLYSNIDYRSTYHKDHLHPFALCSNENYDWDVYDTILNLQILDANENMSKNKMPLKDWVTKETTDITKDAFLKSHLIPDVDLNLENFNNFIEERRRILRSKIREIFGISDIEYQENFDDLSDEEELDDYNQ